MQLQQQDRAAQEQSGSTPHLSLFKLNFIVTALRFNQTQAHAWQAGLAIISPRCPSPCSSPSTAVGRRMIFPFTPPQQECGACPKHSPPWWWERSIPRPCRVGIGSVGSCSPPSTRGWPKLRSVTLRVPSSLTDPRLPKQARLYVPAFP